MRHCHSRRASAGLVLLVGCGAGSAPDAGSDACPEGEVVDFVIASYTVQRALTAAMLDEAPGFDLDGQISAGFETDDCTDYNPDFVSPVTAARGIDNQLTGALYGLAQAFSPTFDLDPQLDAEIASGRNVLAIRLNGVSDLCDDLDVSLELVRIRDRECGGDFCPVTDLADVEAWTPRGTTVGSGVGLIRDGVLEARLDGFPLVFTDTVLTEILVRDARLRCEVTTDSLSRCELGGVLLVEDVLAFVASESSEPGFVDILRGVVLDAADMLPSAADRQICDGLSAGLELTAVSASIE